MYDLLITINPGGSHRDIHSSSHPDPVDSSDDGHMLISFEPAYAADSLYSGVAHVDTPAWFPVRMEMTMSELPSKVKEMAMVAIFEPDGDGVYRPASVIGKGRAKFLLMNFYFRTETEFEW